jgi:tetratricopeptide (TPR) repeat protein
MMRPTILVLAILLVLPPPAAAEEESLEAEAIRLYEAGDYPGALVKIEQLDAEGLADGPMLYRLYFCQQARRDARARDTLDRAREQLEAEVATSTDLAVPFYLSNIYGNVGRLTDRGQVASRTTARIESGELAEPATALDMFRVGKLYADQENTAAAHEWYGKALDAFAVAGDAAPPAYVVWAARSLGEEAYRAGDYEVAERYLGLLVKQEDVQVADYDLLAMSRVRVGKYAEAGRAWNKAELLDPARGDRARYCKNLASQAYDIGVLPATAPDGRAWSELTKEDLEATMLDQATAARQAIAEAVEAGTLRGPPRREIQAKIDPMRAWFMAAGLEYALRGHGIREAAFFGGYAPMVFRPREWRLPRPPDPPAEPEQADEPEKKN